MVIQGALEIALQGQSGLAETPAVPHPPEESMVCEAGKMANWHPGGVSGKVFSWTGGPGAPGGLGELEGMVGRKWVSLSLRLDTVALLECLLSRPALP